jgi:hypothetical protein
MYLYIPACRQSMPPSKCTLDVALIHIRKQASKKYSMRNGYVDAALEVLYIMRRPKQPREQHPHGLVEVVLCWQNTFELVFRATRILLRLPL